MLLGEGKYWGKKPIECLKFVTSKPATRALLSEHFTQQKKVKATQYVRLAYVPRCIEHSWDFLMIHHHKHHWFNWLPMKIQHTGVNKETRNSYFWYPVSNADTLLLQSKKFSSLTLQVTACLNFQNSCSYCLLPWNLSYHQELN